MVRTDEVEALRDAAEMIDGIAEAIAAMRGDRPAPPGIALLAMPATTDLFAFAEHLLLLAEQADERTFRGEWES